MAFRLASTLREPWTQEDIAWVAGFLEGEGCFFTSPTKSPGVKVLSTDRDVLAKYAALVGKQVKGPYADNRGHKDRWEVNVYGLTAVKLMDYILPWMGERRQAKIEEVLHKAMSYHGKWWENGLP